MMAVPLTKPEKDASFASVGKTTGGTTSGRRFLLARLHSLAGIIPLGIFLLEHLYANAVALLGPEAYDSHVRALHSIPFLPFFEIVLIGIPLLYHAVFGIYMAFLSQNNALSYSYSRNWKFVLQRASGLVTFVFVAYHLWAFRLSSAFFGTEVNYSAVREHLQHPAIFAFYVLGVVSTTFHFSNGLWTGLITWGITVGAKAQRVSERIAFSLFVILTAIGIAALFAF
ncbi:succinate dehydrogenase cytochrome B558 [Bacillaceae bacterium]